MIKDLIYLGVGGALLAKEKIEEELNSLVQKGKISKDDAKKILEEAKSKAYEEEQKIKQKVKEALKEVIEELNLATKDDIKELKEICKKDKA
ncbi:MAG: hypothetical protein GXN91_03945 [Epsilonproteobacteria bacterium]|nr:hypothetical protein [Campylobacterota bacterium]